MKLSLIFTVLNEGNSLRPLLESLCRQSRQPDEVVVADGGSADGTVRVLQEYAGRLNLRVLETPGSNIAQGRNEAIRAAVGDVIAVTDAGVVCEAEWLERLVTPFASPPAPPAPLRSGDHGLLTEEHGQERGDAPSPGWVLSAGAGRVGVGAGVAGFFKSAPRSAFEVAMGATVLPDAEEINPATYLPSSRSVAFFKSAWEAVGGYPEWLDYSEDVVFDQALRARYGPFQFVPEALVHFRPRSSLGEFFRQYYQYARGDGRAGLFTRLHLIRYFTYLVAVPLGVYAALTVSPWLWLLGALAGLAYVRRPLFRLRSKLGALTPQERFEALALIPVIRIVGDAAKMCGWPVGVMWRITRG